MTFAEPDEEVERSTLLDRLEEEPDEDTGLVSTE